MITLAGLQLPTLLGGALVTETIFTWPGMGRLYLDSIGYRDYPVIMGLLMFTALLVLVGNLARRPAVRRRRSAHPARLTMRLPILAAAAAPARAAAALRRFVRHRLALFGLAPIVVLVLACAVRPLSRSVQRSPHRHSAPLRAAVPGAAYPRHRPARARPAGAAADGRADLADGRLRGDDHQHARSAP